MSLVLRNIKGSKLSTEEMDGNLTYLEGLTQMGGGGNPFPAIGETLKEFLEDEYEWSGVSYSHGTQEVEDIFKFSLGDFFSALGEEDPETFKAPIIREEGNYIVVSGTRLQATGKDGESITLLNGMLFPRSGDFFGGGSFLQSDGGSAFFGESLNLPFVNQKYFYFFDDEEEEHIHNFEINASVFGLPLTLFNVVVPDDATVWGDVGVNIVTLSSQG
jgi:hypothetical protein